MLSWGTLLGGCGGESTRPDTSDRIAPTVSFTSPANGAEIAGSPQLAVSATDNVGVASVRFSEGQTQLGVDATAPYRLQWTTPAIGEHTVRAEAVDTAGNVGWAELTITIIASPPAAPRPTSIVKHGDAQLALYADQPATDSIGVTVLDQFGAPMPGRTVTWAADSGAGSVSATTTATDSLGRAAIVWTLGRRAGQNRVVATVGGFAPIAYSITLVPSSIVVSPDSIVMWAFDGQLATYEVRDPNGVPLDIGTGLGAPPAWSMDDPGIATIAPDGIILALSEGETVARVTFAGLSDSLPLVVGSTILGRITSITGDDPSTVRIFATHANPASLDSADVDADGLYILRVRKPVTGKPVQLHIDARDRTQRRYHPSLRTVTFEGAPINAVLVPKRWSFSSGPYSGQVVPISANAAVGNGVVQSDFGIMNFWREVAPEAMADWPESAFPLAVYFDRQRSLHQVTQADSLAIWSVIDDMEARFGKDLFYPEDAADIPLTGLSVPTIDGNPDTVWVRLNAVGIAIDNDGIVKPSGSFRYCHPDNHPTACLPVVNRVSGSAQLQAVGEGLGVVDRELMKVLGMGNTCYWNTRVYAATSPSETASCQTWFIDKPGAWPPSTSNVSALDVAHWAVLHYVAHTSRIFGPKFGIPEAANGERVLELGLPPIEFPVVPWP